MYYIFSLPILDAIDRKSGNMSGKKGMGTGKETLRLRSKGPATVEIVSILGINV